RRERIGHSGGALCGRELVVSRLRCGGGRRSRFLRRSQLGGGLISDALCLGGRSGEFLVVLRFVRLGFNFRRRLGIRFRLHIFGGHLLLRGGESSVRLIGRLFRFGNRFADNLGGRALISMITLGGGQLGGGFLSRSLRRSGGCGKRLIRGFASGQFFFGRLHPFCGAWRISHQVANRLAVGGRPDADFAGPVARNHPGRIMAEDRGQCHIGQCLDGALLSAVLVPHLGEPVAATGNQPAVTAEFHRQGGGAVAPVLDVAAVLHLPEANRAVLAARGEHIR